MCPKLTDQGFALVCFDGSLHLARIKPHLVERNEQIR